MRRIVALTVVALAFGSVGTAVAAPGICNGIDVTDDRATEFADFLTGSADRDVIALGDGNDQYFGAESGDIICGNAGDDLLVGETGPDELTGGIGDDTLAGMSGADDLVGGYGLDILDGGGGSDILGAGLDDGQQDELFDGQGVDVIIGNDEDVWHKCEDGMPDDRTGFSGTVVIDPDC